MKRIDAAAELCTLVFTGNLPLLKRYMAAGIEVQPGDFCGAHLLLALLQSRSEATSKGQTKGSLVVCRRLMRVTTTSARRCTSLPARATCLR